MPPPNLPRDAPILDVLEPVLVGLRPMRGMEFHMAVAQQRECLGHVRILEEPLLAQARLDRHARAFADADVVLVGLFLLEQAALPQHLGGTLARVEAVGAVQLRRVVLAGVVDLAVGREDVAEREVVPLADLVVDLVMRGRHLQHAGAEAFLHRVVGDDRNLLAMERTPHAAADEMRPFAAGFHRQRDVGHDRLGTRGGDDEEIGIERRKIRRSRFARGRNLGRGGQRGAFLHRHAMRGIEISTGVVGGGHGIGVIWHELVLHIIECALLLGRNHFLIAQRGER